MAVLTKIDASLAHLRKVEDLDDLARILFPGNPRHQHACAAILFILKWSDGVVVDLASRTRAHGVTRRVLERTRAKMRHIGLIEHVSRFNHQHGYRDGWILSGRFERSLHDLAQRIGEIRSRTAGSQQEKDAFAVSLLKPARPIGAAGEVAAVCRGPSRVRCVSGSGRGQEAHGVRPSRGDRR